MKTAKDYWNLKIEETKKVFLKRPSWMGNYDNDYPCAAFIKGLISDFKPQNILEVGTAAGWAAYYMLEEASKYSSDAKLTSIDISQNIYYNPSKKVGDAFFEVNPELYKKWNLKTNTILAQFLIDCEEEFDFVFIDGSHSHPWASLDFLAVLPHLKKDAIVVFHDIFLNEIALGQKKADRHPQGVVCGENKFRGPNILYNYLKDKMTLCYDDITPNCAALICDDKNKMLEGIFHSLDEDWEVDVLFNSSEKEFLRVLDKHLDVAKKYFNKKTQQTLLAIMSAKFVRLKAQNEIRETQILSKIKQDATLLNSMIEKKKTVLWGAGLFFEKAVKNSLLNLENVVCVVDSNPSKHGKTIGGIKICSVDEIKNLRVERIVSAVANSKSMKEKIVDALKEKSVPIDFDIVADFY